MRASYDGSLRFHYRCNGWLGWDVDGDGEMGTEVCLKCGMTGCSRIVQHPELFPRLAAFPDAGKYRKDMGDDEGIYEKGAGLPIPCCFEGQEHPFAVDGDKYTGYMNRNGAALWKNRPGLNTFVEFNEEDDEDEENYLS